MYILITQEDTNKYRAIVNPDGSLMVFNSKKEAKNKILELMNNGICVCIIIKLNI